MYSSVSCTAMATRGPFHSGRPSGMSCCPPDTSWAAAGQCAYRMEVCPAWQKRTASTVWLKATTKRPCRVQGAQAGRGGWQEGSADCLLHTCSTCPSTVLLPACPARWGADHGCPSQVQHIVSARNLVIPLMLQTAMFLFTCSATLKM